MEIILKVVGHLDHNNLNFTLLNEVENAVINQSVNIKN